MKTFNDCFALVIGTEGGYSDNPHDPGSETMYGITKRVAEANGYTGLMRNLPLATAQSIAKKCYWDLYHCDAFDIRIGYLIFDIQYNGGYSTKWLQKIVGVQVDGVMGQETMNAVKALNPLSVCMDLIAERVQYWTSLPTWSVFGKGWANRAAMNLKSVAA